MKKLTALLLAALALTSCTAGTDDIAEGLETYRDVYGGETEGNCTAPAEIADGILSQDFILKHGRYYFELERYGTVEKEFGSVLGHNVMLAYMDTETGNWSYACSDPLCSHDSELTCRYVNLAGCYPTETPGVYYCCRTAEHASEILLADLNRDTVKHVHTMAATFSDIIGYENGKLYFYDKLRSTDGKQTKTVIRFSALDHATGEITELGYLPDTWPYQTALPDLVLDGRFYFRSNRKLIRTDPSFREITEILETEFEIAQWYLDQNTGELFVSSVDREQNRGSVYVYRDGSAEKLALPHENIFSFTVTADKIYYTAFDPVYYGISPITYYMNEQNTPALIYDYSGGRLYAADRDNPSENAELVYEIPAVPANTMPHLWNIAVLGDYLFYEEISLSVQVIAGTEYVQTEDTAKIRVNLADGTTTKISFAD
ncbi:MAG: hypothetical protein IJF78_02475 [Clostridia bacterium]|nr:hypothetical protein [Clostridia bacterium]